MFHYFFPFILRFFAWGFTVSIIIFSNKRKEEIINFDLMYKINNYMYITLCIYMYIKAVQLAQDKTQLQYMYHKLIVAEMLHSSCTQL